jgi:hypothetical protein
MFISIYNYLQSEILASVNIVFPDVKISKDDCSLIIAPEHSLFDLSSSVALKIHSQDLSFSNTAQKIASLINYDNHFVQSDPDNVFTSIKGFINFKLSSKYISNVISNTSAMVITTPDSFTDPMTSSVLSITKAILSQTDKIMQKDELSAPDFELLCTNEELRIGRFLGIAPLFPDCKPFRNKSFFKKRIAEAFMQFYKKTRIITPDCKLTFARVELVKAVQNAIMIL